jgi:hypothetical protein
MRFTNLTVTKIGRNEFWIDVTVYQSLGGVLRTLLREEYHVSSIPAAQAVLSSFPSRECQRDGVSTRVANRFRTAKSGDLCFTARWDGGAGRNHGHKTREGESLYRFVPWCPRRPGINVELLRAIKVRVSVNNRSEG